MSKFQAFSEAYWVGKAKAAENQLEQEDTLRHLPVAVGELVQKMCAYFQCPKDRAHYLELETNTVSSSVANGAPPLRYQPESGQHCLGLEIAVGEDRYPVWLQLAFVLLKHGGFEVHLGSSIFQIPAEEIAFFNEVADAITGELRQSYTPAPLKIGF
jgi:hypothetical protein